MKSRGDLLKYASVDLRADKEVVFEAAMNDGIALQFASVDPFFRRLLEAAMYGKLDEVVRDVEEEEASRTENMVDSLARVAGRAPAPAVDGLVAALSHPLSLIGKRGREAFEADFA